MKRNLPNILTIVLFIVFAFWMLAVKNGFILRWFDEMSLFQPGLESLSQFLLYPEGVFRFADTFLTQLFYYPILGAIALILIWLLCAWLTKIAFRFQSNALPLCLLVPLCMLVSVLHFDEACLTFESQGYLFYNSIGYTFSVAMFALFTFSKGNSTLRTVIAVILPLLYPIAGFFALLPAIMCIINLCLNAKKPKSILPLSTAAISLLLVILVPRLYYRYFTGTTIDNDYLYLKGLPELTMESYDEYLWTPFLVASLLLLLFTLIYSFSDTKKLTGSATMKWSAIGLCLVGLLWCIKADGRKSEQFRATVLMLNAIEQREWSKITHIMSLTKESPNYTMCVLDNLARAYSHKNLQNLGNMMAESKDFRHDENFTIKAFVDVPVNHHMGRFNQSYRWATENNVQYGNKAYFIKYVVRNALMNGDLALAKKFNRMLMQTMFHRQWAETMNKYIENPNLIPTLPDYDFLMALRAEEIMRGE